MAAQRQGEYQRRGWAPEVLLRHPGIGETEASPERHLRIRTRLEPDRDCPVTVEISDTGHGFRQEEVDRLFAPFYTTKKGEHGTGLGLSISLRIVKEHGGVLEAAGAPGQGATFTVRLPRHDSGKA